jgi:uncharacterized protein (DUF362 family)
VRWIIGNTLITGILALGWLALRSGTKPSRLAYPCQRAAMSTATLALGVPMGAALIALRHRMIAWSRTPAGVFSVVAIVLLAAGIIASLPGAGEYRGPVLSAPAEYRAQIFNVTECHIGPTGDRFIGVDNLIALMGREGLKFYDSATESLASGPGGIIAAGDVVLVKINYQWSQRGGTNVDLLSGVIRRIVDHPDGFSGEIVVCENAQFASVSGFDRTQNNSQGRTRSPHDVVVDFQALGFDISHYDWTAVRNISVGEYSAGDMTDGYIVYSYDPEVQARVSYPKFQSDYGTYISVRDGVWDPVGETYDPGRLKLINIPVLKSHGAVYGATVCVKNYMGLVTDALGTSSHGGVGRGLLGTVLGEVGLADLNIIDAIFINADPNTGPSTGYTGATRRKELCACVDPVAGDMWAVKNILIPAFLDNGFTPPWPTPSADPDDSTSEFRNYLDRSMYQMLDAGFLVTNDTTRIDALRGNGAAGDFDADVDVDSLDYEQFAECFTGAGGGPVDSACSVGDFDGDGDVDCEDWDSFQFVWTASGDVPPLVGCAEAGIDPPSVAGGARISAFPNPMKASTRISYSVERPGRVTLRIIDLRGRAVRALVEEDMNAGDYTVPWDGRNDKGVRVAGGVYFCRLDAAGAGTTRKIIVSK